jgi:hypothetical protein
MNVKYFFHIYFVKQLNIYLFFSKFSVLPLIVLYIVIARSVSDVAISERDSFTSLGMTDGK